MKNETDNLVAEIAKTAKIIAMVGASPDPERPSNEVMRYLQQEGYRVIPVNPGHTGKTINGELVYSSLEEIPLDKTGKIDMVDIFRNSADAAEATRQAIKIGAKFVWMQLGVINQAAATEARQAGLKVVMNRCPAIDFPKLKKAL